MSKGNTFETELLAHVLQNAALPGIGDAPGLQPSAVAGSLYVALHTANPGEAGYQTTSEATYTSYARVAVARSVGAWTVAAGAAENAALVGFPQCTGGSETITHFSVGIDAAGAGKVLYYGALTASLAVSNGITPEFAAGELDITED